MTKAEIRQESYEATNGEYVYDGQTAAQWREIARERDYNQRDSSNEHRIADVLDDMNGDN